MSAPPVAVEQLSVRWLGSTYPATAIAEGAAFELHSDRPAPGWVVNPDPDGRHPYRRFVHACEVDQVYGAAPTPPDAPLLAPLSRSVTRERVQRLSQGVSSRLEDHALLRTVHRSAAIAPGTRMVKSIRPEAVADHLAGATLIRGFCYRHYDVAHLRTPEQWAVLGVTEPTADLCFALRWRAVNPSDYAVAWADQLPGLLGIPVSQRIGPPVLGTGFAYSDDQLIPEYLTADFADLPLPLHTEILAYLPDGTEVVLYQYLAEHMWARVANRRLDHVLGRIPGVDPAKQYHPVRATPTTGLLGHPQRPEGRRFVRCVAGTGGRFTVIAAERGYLRVRACEPTTELLFQHDLRCIERGIYEGWIPQSEVTDLGQVEIRYDVTT